MNIVNSMRTLQPFMKEILPWFLGVVALVSCTSLVVEDARIMYLNNRAVALVEKGNTESAKRLFDRAVARALPLSYVSESNEAVTLYKSEKYPESVEYWEAVYGAKCTQAPAAKYCDTVAYNLGNALYRVGEQLLVAASSTASSVVVSEDDTWRKQVGSIWEQAIGAYQADLAINPEDTQAQENIDFIMSKLEVVQSPAQEQGEGGDSSDESSADAQEGSEGESSDSSQGAENEGAESSGSEGTEESGSATGGDSSSSSGTEDMHLSAEAEQQVEQYMQQLEQKERSLDDYFNRTGESPQQSSNSPFDDPFFQQFLQGTPLESQLSSGQQSLDKDW